MTTPRIVILGGYGTFGSLIAEQLARPDAEVVICGRDVTKGRALAESLQARFVRCDARSRDSLRHAVAGAQMVINAAGPFQAKDYSIPQICIEQGCHYVDLGDGREYVAGIGQLHDDAKARSTFVCVGASTTPAITSAAVAELRPHFQHIRSIKVALTAGNKNQAGVSTIASILAYVGSPVRVYQDVHQVAFWYKVLDLQIPLSVTMTGANFLSPKMEPDTIDVSMRLENLLFTWNSAFGNRHYGETDPAVTLTHRGRLFIEIESLPCAR
jgi:short subunit dehydrogenase-like uncharacterized protein